METKQKDKTFWLLTYFIVHITILTIFCFWDYHFHKKLILKNIDNRLFHNAIALKYIIPSDLHDRALDEQSIDIKEDLYLAKKLTQFVEETGLKYAYTIIKQDNQLYFVLSDLTADPETERGTFYFYPYDDAESIFFEAFNNNKPLYKTVSDQWGTVRTAIVPEESTDGTQYLLCIDYDINYVNSMFSKNLGRTSLTALCFLLFTSLIVYIYIRIQQNHLRVIRESEEQYRSIFQNSVGGFFQSEPDGRFIEVNPAFAKILGYSSPQDFSMSVSNMSINFYLNDADFQHVTETLRRNGLIEKFEFKARRKNNTEVWVSSSIWGILNKGGGLIRYEGNLEDISERKDAEVEINRLNQFQKTIIDNASIWLNVLDHEGNVLVWNKAAESISGYSKEDIIGNSKVWEWCYPDSEYRAQIVEQASKIVDRGEDVENFETTICCRNKDEKQISWYSRRLTNDQGSVIGAITLGRDVTSYNNTQKALQESEEKLARSKKMESLGLLAGGVAHDLNNVLSGIVSYPELILLELPEDSKFRKPIQTIMDSGFRASAIVQDLLTIARGVAIKKQIIDLNDLIQDYLGSPEFAELLSSHANISVSQNLERNLFKISGSTVHLSKVIMNLVSNAIEAQVGSGTVSLSTRNCCIDRTFRGYEDVATGEYVALSVQDSGTGISEKDLDRIFEPFYSKKEMGRSGTGLGLAVVWNITQDHRGFIDVHTGDSGTTFELYFPITREEPVNEIEAVSFKQYAGHGETILVVDDIESQREISCKMVGALGYKFIAVASGEEALEYLTNNSVNLVLLDMIMDPGISGRETYERILQIHSDQKAVIVSGFAETLDVQYTQKIGAGSFLKKPLSLKELGKALKTELDSKK